MSSNEFATQWAIELPDGELFKSAMSGAVITWSERAGAEHVLEQLRVQASFMGITEYGGRIGRRFCTPFIFDTDNGDALMDELSKWLSEQTGGGPS